MRVKKRSLPLSARRVPRPRRAISSSRRPESYFFESYGANRKARKNPRSRGDKGREPENPKEARFGLEPMRSIRTAHPCRLYRRFSFKLPQLPKELDYRFVGRHLILQLPANIIVDYILDAVPAT